MLLAGLTGPATLAAQFATDLSTAGEVFTSLAKAFCAAGADLILVFDAALPTDLGQWADTLKTAGNIARFHRALAMQWDSAAPLPQPAKIPLFAPSKGLAGITVTTEIAAPDVSLEHLKAWITAVSAE